MSSSKAAASIDFPERIGRYQLLVPIGTGGMARVFLARTTGAGGFERMVALKLLHAHLRNSREFVHDLFDEARIAAGVRHPNVVQILDVIEEGPNVYLVMEYVEGDTLSGLGRAARLRGEQLPLGIGIKVLCDALAGLHAAHELRDKRGALVGLVHRDFSPQNILVGTDGAARLTDFGVVKASGKVGHTRTGLVKGKVRYMSPEQARARPIDRRSDVWAAGVLAWELFARRSLYSAADDASILLKIVSETPPLLSEVVPKIAPEINNAVASALCPEPSQRCPTADEFRRQLLGAWAKSEPVPDVGEISDWVTRTTELRRRERTMLIRAIAAERAAPEPLPAEDGTTTRELATRPMDREQHEPGELSPPSQPDPLTESATVTTPDIGFRPVSAVSKRARQNQILIGIGVGIALAIALGTLTLMTRLHTPRPVASASPPAPPPAIEAPNPGASLAPASSAEAPRALVNQIRVLADRPIAKLRIGTRLVAIAPPERDVTVRLTDQELAANERVEATADDGKRMSLELDGTADTVDIDFSSAVQKPRRLPGFFPAKPPAPAPTATGSARAPLAPNPYGKK